MRTFKNYIDDAKRRKLEETGEEGFSLIELIIVVVILGILAAIAIPIFLNVQDNAEKAAVQTAASNGAVVIASELTGSTALTQATADAFLDSLEQGQIVTVTAVTFDKLNNICVTATDGDWKAEAGTAANCDGPVVAD